MSLEAWRNGRRPIRETGEVKPEAVLLWYRQAKATLIGEGSTPSASNGDGRELRTKSTEALRAV